MFGEQVADLGNVAVLNCVKVFLEKSNSECKTGMVDCRKACDESNPGLKLKLKVCMACETQRWSSGTVKTPTSTRLIFSRSYLDTIKQY